MSLLAQQHSVAVTSTSSVLKPRVENRKSTTTIQCLVLSDDAMRQEMLSRAAHEAGWDTVICKDVANAWSTVQRQRFEMAFVDLDGTSSSDGFKEVAEHMSSNHDALLVVCGEEGNAMEEIWARQLGAWLYLPGVSGTSDVSALCREASPVVEKLTGRSFGESVFS